MNKLVAICSMLVLAVLAVGCGSGDESADAGQATAESIKRATAYINSRSGSELYGSAIFINEGAQVTLQVKIEGATPGEYACHIHENGDCSADDGSSAGGHWNPDGVDHGKWGEGVHHLGDIGNVLVGDDGEGQLILTTDRWTMGGGGANDVMGKSVIVHAAPDDFTTQPTGAAGARLGCGVIKAGAGR